jgi:hypothetical protein
MALLSRLGLQVARAYPRPALSVLNRGAPLVHILESISSKPAPYKGRCYSTLPSLAMALSAPSLRLGRRPALLHPAGSRAFELRPIRGYTSWQQPRSSRAGYKVLCAGSFPAALPQEPGRRHSSTKPWWKFWDSSDSKYVLLLSYLSYCIAEEGLQ